MKKLFLTTALISALAAPAFAQTANDGMFLPGIEAGVRASDFIGKRVYVTEADTTGMSETALAAANEDWQDAGEIGDIIISLAGDTQGVLVDFGGFLGIGEKTVAISLDQLTLVPDSSSPDDYFIVFNGTEDTLTNAPAYDRDMVFSADTTTDGMATDGMATDGTMVDPNTGLAADGTMIDPNTGLAADGSATVDGTATDGMATEGLAADGTVENTESGTEMAGGMTAGEMVDLTTWAETDLIGKRVYGPNDEDVGEISAVAVSADGAVEGAVVDVGGFLGMGEKRVSLTSDMLQLVTEQNGDTWFRVNATQEQLEALAPYAS